MKESDNNKISIAEIKKDIGYIIKGVDNINKQLSIIDERVDTNKNELTELKTKLSTTNLFQTGLTIITGSIAAWLGSK